jgi:hypothetical protein
MKPRMTTLYIKAGEWFEAAQHNDTPAGFAEYILTAIQFKDTNEIVAITVSKDEIAILNEVLPE